MESNSCSRCPGWADSPAKVLEILNNQFGACDSCAHRGIIRAVAQQYQMRLPRWWIVDGQLVVPIWIVELLKKHRKIEVDAAKEDQVPARKIAAG